jgi:hypothetical protein
MIDHCSGSLVPKNNPQDITVYTYSCRDTVPLQDEKAISSLQDVWDHPNHTYK